MPFSHRKINENFRYYNFSGCFFIKKTLLKFVRGYSGESDVQTICAPVMLYKNSLSSLKNIIMKKFLSEFKEFAMKGNVVDMAVGVIIGAAFGKIVTSLVNDVIMPVIGVLTGGVNFSDKKWIIQQAVADGETIVTSEVAVTWGAFVQTVIDFIIIAFCIFVAIKFMNKLKRAPEPAPAPEPEAPAAPTQEELLTEIRDLLKKEVESK